MIEITWTADEYSLIAELSLKCEFYAGFNSMKEFNMFL